MAEKKEEFKELTVGGVLCLKQEDRLKVFSPKECLLLTGWKKRGTTKDGKEIFTKKSSIWGQE